MFTIKILNFSSFTFGNLTDINFKSLLKRGSESSSTSKAEVFEISDEKEAKEFSEKMKEFPTVKYRINSEHGVADWGSGWIEESKREKSYQF